MSQHLCVSGSSARSMSLDSCLSIHVYLRILCKIHAAGSIAQQPYVSQEPLQDPRLRIHVSASLYLTDSLQDPCLRIHVSASLYLRLLCKIHVCGFMSQHPYVSQEILQDPCLRIRKKASICISGSSARSMSPDLYLSMHMYLRPLCKIRVSGSVYKHAYVSQDPLRDPCLRIHVSASICISGTSARSMSPDPYISIHMYVRLLCKIHVSGSVYKHAYVSQDPLRDPCLRIHVSASICISGTSARSMSPDPYISMHMYLRVLCKIHVSDSCLSIFISQGPLQDPCLRIHVSASSNLRILCKIHVSDSRLSIHVSASIYISGSFARSMSPDSCLSIFVSQDPLQDPCLWIHVSTSISQDLLQDPCLRFMS